MRELFQNGMDAHEQGLLMTYSFDEKLRQLAIKNEGASLPRESLVLGVTSKRNAANQRGEFGEGYKLAMATLCRLGAHVTIFNGKEIWIPELIHSDVFNTEVLSFTIKPSAIEHSLTIVVTGIPVAEWELANERLLFLYDTQPKALSCNDGSILLEPQYAGKLYVKGIFVNDLPDKHKFGYDLSKIKLDRDRQIPDIYALRYALCCLLKRTTELGLLKPLEVLEILEAESGEIRAFDADFAKSPVFEKIVAEAFDTKYGKDAIPVKSLDDSIRAKDFALKGVIVNSTLLRILNNTKVSLNQIVESMVLLPTKIWSANELSNEEISNLKWAVELTARVEPISLTQISVVDFIGDKLYGKFEFSTEHVSIARRILCDKVELIATMVHEICHRYGPDGDLRHRYAVENRLSKLILLGQN
jgi:hypothetical protein